MRELTYVDATLEALDSAMARDPSIFVVGEGIGERGGNFNTHRRTLCQVRPRAPA